MKKIGLYAGSFNPIHIGHLALANWICEFEDLSEVWFLITPQNPLKEISALLDYELRYKMAREATKGYPKFKVSDFERTLPLPSYTINTLNALREKFPDHQFYLLIGADSWEIMNQWKEAPALLKEYHIIIYPRKGYEKSITCGYPMVKIVKAPLIEISSSFIREALKSGKDVRFFLPEAVRKYTDSIKKQTI